MNEMEFRILDMLARELGNPMSISDTAKKVRELYGRGDYKNIHKTIQDFANKGIIITQKAGNTIIAELNFENYLLVDLLAETELIKKIKFLEKHQELQAVLSEINMHTKDLPGIQSLLLSNPQRNAKLNRLELLLIKQNKKDKEPEKFTSMLDRLGTVHNIRIDHLTLEDKAFLDLITSQETNITKEVLKTKLILFGAQTFWMEIKDAINKGYNIESKELTRPSKVSENEHIYNLGRFGYAEFGNKTKYGKLLGIEFLITSILLKKNTRHIEAIPVILAKNEDKINYNLLVFLSMKYGTIGKLYGMLKAINAINPTKKLSQALKGLSGRKIQEVKANPKEIKEKLRLYNVIK